MPFEKGNKGRPLGSRNKYGHAFWVDLEKTWRLGGAAALQKVMKDDPSTFVRVCASLIPKEVEITHRQAASLTDEEIIARIAELRDGTGVSDDAPEAPLNPSQLN
jgi:hypothetical protein